MNIYLLLGASGWEERAVFTINFPFETWRKLIQIHDNITGTFDWPNITIIIIFWKGNFKKRESAELVEISVSPLSWTSSPPNCQAAGPLFNLLLSFNSHLSKKWGSSCPLSRRSFPQRLSHFIKTWKRAELICCWAFWCEHLAYFLSLLSVFHKLFSNIE